MAQIPGRIQAAFPLTVVATAALAFMPASWMSVRGWSNRLADAARWPMSPIGFAGTWLAERVRPGVRVEAPENEDALDEMSRALAFATQEAERYKRTNLELRMRVAGLEQQVAELQQIPLSVRAVAGAPISAETAITSRGPSAVKDVVELKVPEEAKGRISAESTIAVHEAVNLLGRVTEVSAYRVMMLPITNRATSWIKAVIIPADKVDDPDYEISKAARIQLVPTGEGTLRGDATAAKDIGRGDKVILNDPNWPAWAQAMVVGLVEDVKPKESEPLLQEVTVKPRVLVSDVARVTLLAGGDGTGGEKR